MGTAEVLASQEIMPGRRVTKQEQLFFGAQGVDGRVPRGCWISADTQSGCRGRVNGMRVLRAGVAESSVFSPEHK